MNGNSCGKLVVHYATANGKSGETLPFNGKYLSNLLG
jgi:hypothetical protein